MFNFKSSFAVCAAVAIAVVGFGQVASAQPLPEDDYVQVGEAEDGNAIMLDKTSINGGNFELGQLYGSGLKETSMRVSCSENRVFLKRIAAMKIVCQGMGARGW